MGADGESTPCEQAQAQQGSGALIRDPAVTCGALTRVRLPVRSKRQICRLVPSAEADASRADQSANLHLDRASGRYDGSGLSDANLLRTDAARESSNLKSNRSNAENVSRVWREPCSRQMGYGDLSKHALLHRLRLPGQQFGKPHFGGLDDLLIERRDQGIDRGIVDRLEHPIAMLDPQVLQHGKRLLAFLDDGAERNHDLRYRRLQFERGGLLGW